MTLPKCYGQAFVISKIAHSDWPDHYPTLLHDLILLLESRTPESIHGALQVFTEFSRDDLTEDQILPVLRQLLPILLSILGQAEVRDYSPSDIDGNYLSTLNLYSDIVRSLEPEPWVCSDSVSRQF
jgi:hypothetical protein